MYLRAVKVLIGSIPVVCLLYILNQNAAFFGTHRITVHSFSQLPKSVTFAGGADVGVVATPNGSVTRPYTDQVKFAVTLPRGFETMTMAAEVDADPFATLTLSARTSAVASQSASFRLPTAFGSSWRSTTLDGGRLFIQGHENIQNADAFWSAFKTFRKVYTLSGDLASAIPSNLYAASADLRDVHLASDYRGPLIMNVFLSNETKSIQFSKRDLDYTPGPDTLHFSLERAGNVILTRNIEDGSGQRQLIEVSLPELQGGFYTLRFTPNNEDSLLSDVRFRGADVHIQQGVFLGPAPQAVTLYTTCSTFIAAAAHDLGLQSSFTVNGRKVDLKAVKQENTVRFTGPIGTIVIPRGDVSLSSPCGFQLKPEHPIRQAFTALTKRITPLPAFTSGALKKAEVVFDTAKPVEQKGKSGYVIEETFDLHTLSAKGKTFTFALESPGLTTRPGAYLHITRVTFTARRPAFSLSDVPKAFKAIFTR